MHDGAIRTPCDCVCHQNSCSPSAGCRQTWHSKVATFFFQKASQLASFSPLMRTQVPAGILYLRVLEAANLPNTDIFTKTDACPNEP